MSDCPCETIGKYDWFHNRNQEKSFAQVGLIDISTLLTYRSIKRDVKASQPGCFY